ncbi:MAG TPA: hypothetical protein VHD76_06455 [Bryobacteraceae bacterium]|jgi:hypothetical protein|nr:hypothetical protein [Bryobacteraceae bacterium]
MDNEVFIRFVRENLPILMFVFLLVVLAGGWVVFESARSLLRRDDVDKLRRRVEELEREQARLTNPTLARRVSTDPVVLTTRWVSKGRAATSSDGGCLVLVDEVIPARLSALLTVRVDGEPAHQRYPFQSGECVEVEGKFGFYTVEVGAISGDRVQVTGWLRSRHSTS